MATNTSIIKKPWITEKATAGAKTNQYVFMVQSNAAKPEVKKAIAVLYKVEVVAVNMVNRHPKHKRFGGNRKGVQEGYRKAIVTIKEGQKIDFN
jgi:large subunit ribosomal protein L23